MPDRRPAVRPLVGPGRHERDAQCGQILPLVALLLVVAAGAALLVVHMGVVVDDRARASAAADAAALAGAAEGRAAAATIARANGAELESFVREGNDTVVVVRVGAARAVARASLTPAAPPATWHPG